MCILVVEDQKDLNEIIVRKLTNAHYSVDACYTGDEVMMIRVILNLMDNAIKFGRGGGSVKMSLRKEDSFAVCRVADDGIGIALERLDKMWERPHHIHCAGQGAGSDIFRYLRTG